MDSITQKFFLTAPRKTNTNKKKRKSVAVIENDIKYEAYEELWSTLQEKFDRVFEVTLTKSISDIGDYFKSYKFSSSKQIPVLTLLKGINLSDHVNLFQLIEKKVKATIESRIVLMQPSHDKTGKSMIEYMVQRFMSNKDNDGKQLDYDEIEDADEDVMLNIFKKRKKSIVLMRRLHYWHIKLKDGVNHDFPLVVIIPNTESYSSELLNTFFFVLSQYKRKIPFILIMGIATEMKIIHQRITEPVLQHFNFHILKSEQPLTFLHNVLEKVLMDPDCPFKLNERVLDELINIYVYYNFSVQYFVRGIQLCVMNHIFESTYKILCCPIDRVSEIIKSLNKDEMNGLLQLPSIGVENISRKERGLVALNKTKNVKAEIEIYIRDLHKHVSRFHLAVRCLYIIVKSLPGMIFHKQLYNVYCNALKPSFTKSNEFEQCFQQFKCLSVDKILEAVVSIEKILRVNDGDEKITQTLGELTKFCNKLQNVHDLDKESSPKKRRTSPNCSITLSSSFSRSPVKRKSLFQSPKKENSIFSESNIKAEITSPENWPKMNNCSQNGTPITQSSAISDSDDSLINLRNMFVTPTSSPQKSPTQNNITNINENSLEKPSPLKNGILTPLKTTVNCLNSPPGIRSSPRKLPNMSTPKSQMIAKMTPSSRGDFMQTLHGNAHKEKRAITPWDQIKYDLIHFLRDEFFKTFLESPKKVPFNEIIFYDNEDGLKNFSNVNHIRLYDRNLTNPYSNLKCACCHLKTPDDFPETLPDLCISYKLLAEYASENVDLNLWLKSFSCKIRGIDNDEIDKEVYNRFMQTVRELQLMGFILPNNYNPNRIKKVRYGNGL